MMFLKFIYLYLIVISEYIEKNCWFYNDRHVIFNNNFLSFSNASFSKNDFFYVEKH